MNHDEKKKFRICRCFFGIFLIGVFIPTLFSAQTIWAGEKDYDLAVIYTEEYKNQGCIAPLIFIFNIYWNISYGIISNSVNGRRFNS